MDKERWKHICHHRLLISYSFLKCFIKNTDDFSNGNRKRLWWPLISTQNTLLQRKLVWKAMQLGTLSLLWINDGPTQIFIIKLHGAWICWCSLQVLQALHVPERHNLICSSVSSRKVTVEEQQIANFILNGLVFIAHWCIDELLFSSLLRLWALMAELLGGVWKFKVLENFVFMIINSVKYFQLRMLMMIKCGN